MTLQDLHKRIEFLTSNSFEIPDFDEEEIRKLEKDIRLYSLLTRQLEGQYRALVLKDGIEKVLASTTKEETT